MIFGIMPRRIDNSKTVSAEQAQRNAHLIASGAIVFQVARVMVRTGIFACISSEGRTMEEIAASTGLPLYGVKVLLEASLTAGTVEKKDGLWSLSKTGWFLLNDPMVKVDMDFNHDVNYRGFFYLEESLRNGKPEGLKTLGEWPTIYEGLSSLEPQVRKSWFAFDHFYSDSSFGKALEIVFATHPARILDIGGNTGKWAMQCTSYDPAVELTIMDLPQQIGLMKENTASFRHRDRISGYPADILDVNTVFPTGYDVVWMSQFLDCFSSAQAAGILERARKALADGGRIFIMETLWDRQKYDTAAFDLTQISLYFTVMANGNSKMFSTDDLVSCIREAGLSVAAIHDDIGYGHSILECVPEK